MVPVHGESRRTNRISFAPAAYTSAIPSVPNRSRSLRRPQMIRHSDAPLLADGGQSMATLQDNLQRLSTADKDSAAAPKSTRTRTSPPHLNARALSNLLPLSSSHDSPPEVPALPNAAASNMADPPALRHRKSIATDLLSSTLSKKQQHNLEEQLPQKPVENTAQRLPTPQHPPSHRMTPAETPVSSSSTTSNSPNPSSSSKTTIVRLPLTPEATVRQFRSLLTPYEQTEIFEFPEIYFAGAQKIEKVGGSKRRTGSDLAEIWNVDGTHKDRDLNVYNMGFDDSRGDLYLTRHDHICYRYEILSLLGKGSFGQVVKCYDHKTKTNVALKIIRNKKRFEKQGAVEVKVLCRLRDEDPENDNALIHILDHFHFRGHLCLTFELLGPNLYEWLRSGSFKGVHLGVIRRFTHQMLKCLQVLERTDIIHSDLKPENVLLKDMSFLQPLRCDVNFYPSSTASSRPPPLSRIPADFDPAHARYEIKVIDFGSSCFKDERMYTYVQSRFYRSPEVILGIPYSTEIDMWSMGCILAELCTGYPLFAGENEAEQLACIMEVRGLPSRDLLEKGSRSSTFFDSNGQPRMDVDTKGRRRRPMSRSLSSVLKCADMAFLDFIDRCLIWDATQRMRPYEAAQHPFVTGARFIPLPTTASGLSSYSQKRAAASSAAMRPVASLDNVSTSHSVTKDYQLSIAVALPPSAHQDSSHILDTLPQSTSNGLSSDAYASHTKASLSSTANMTSLPVSSHAAKQIANMRMKHISLASIQVPTPTSSKPARVMTAPSVEALTTRQMHLSHQRPVQAHYQQSQNSRLRQHQDMSSATSRGLFPSVAGHLLRPGVRPAPNHNHSTADGQVMRHTNMAPTVAPVTPAAARPLTIHYYGPGASSRLSTADPGPSMYNGAESAASGGMGGGLVGANVSGMYASDALPPIPNQPPSNTIINDSARSWARDPRRLANRPSMASIQLSFDSATAGNDHTIVASSSGRMDHGDHPSIHSHMQPKGKSSNNVMMGTSDATSLAVDGTRFVADDRISTNVIAPGTSSISSPRWSSSIVEPQRYNRKQPTSASRTVKDSASNSRLIQTRTWR